jgi:acetylornithine/succinyldiaminopimelate/putrescine aminotransferase
VLKTVNTPEFLQENARKGNRIMEALRSTPKGQEVRGRGLMIGFDIENNAWPVLEAGIEKGLLMLSAGANTLRLLPPYIISDSEIDQGLAIIAELLDAS